jgi:hypothetical protein
MLGSSDSHGHTTRARPRYAVTRDTAPSSALGTGDRRVVIGASSDPCPTTGTSA